MANEKDDQNYKETMEELRVKLGALRQIIENDIKDEEARIRSKGTRPKESIIDGKFLSFVFVVVLVLIICVSIYAFSNLYYAVLKKYPGKEHSEL